MSIHLPNMDAIELADIAGLVRPGNDRAHNWLLSCYSCVEDAIESGAESEDDLVEYIPEYADGIVPAYYYDQWELIGDLQLWHEDVSSWGECDTLQDAMARAIYEAGSRVMYALASRIIETEDVPW